MIIYFFYGPYYYRMNIILFYFILVLYVGMFYIYINSPEVEIIEKSKQQLSCYSLKCYNKTCFYEKNNQY